MRQVAIIGLEHAQATRRFSGYEKIVTEMAIFRHLFELSLRGRIGTLMRATQKEEHALHPRK